MEMKRLVQSTATLSFLLAPPAYCVDLVLDTAVLAEAASTASSAAEQVAAQAKDYALQLKQYDDMVTNTLAPVAWVWNETTRTYQMVRTYSDMLQYYASGGGVAAYLATFQNASHYMGSPCFSPRGCSMAEIMAIRDSQRLASDAQKLANDSQMRGVSLGQDQLQEDAARLAEIQSAAMAAKGRNEMMGAANQLASANANNLFAVRALMLQQQEAENARNATLENHEAIRHAADEAALRGEFVPSPELDYAKYSE